MFKRLFTRRRGVAVASAALAMSGMSLALAGTAVAAPNAAVVLGSGAQTSYSTMVGLSDLFNGSPGCDLTAATALPLQLNCGTTSFAKGSAAGEQGFSVAGENPYNDLAAQEAPTGSNSALTQIESSANYPADYARASSSPTASNSNTAQNFVKWATDAVSWTSFKSLAGVGTQHKAVKDISSPNLKAIYNYTLTCTDTVGATTYTLTDDWFCLPGYAGTTTLTPTGSTTGFIDPIDCYVSQTGAGTFTTWSAYNGFSKTALPACLNHEKSGTAASHENLFQNSMHQISGQSDAKYALYFYSFGAFATTCPAGVCQDTPSGDVTTFGKVDGFKADQATVQGTGGGVGVTFPVTRGLYSTYNNSSAVAPQVPANQATLNLVSEYGFLCKASTNTDIDPQTGVSYRTEIESVIYSQGFFPLDISPSNTFAEGTLTNPAHITDAGYAANDPTTPTKGYCLVSNGG